MIVVSYKAGNGEGGGGNGNKSVEKWTKESWTSVGDGGGGRNESKNRVTSKRDR